MRPDRLVDDRTGIVTGVAPVALPDGPLARLATVCETAHFGLASGAPATSGCSWRDSDLASRAAIGEAVERYCGHLVDASRLRWGSYREWATQGVDAVEPRTLALYRPGQHRRPDFAFAGLDRDDHVAWVESSDGAGGAVLVPAALVWLAPGAHSATANGRQVTLPVNAGIAAGPTLASARRAALAEVVERHCLAQAWHGAAAFPLLSTTGATEVRLVPNRFGLAVALAVCRNDDEGLLGVGCSASSTWSEATAKAAAEAAFMVGTARLVAAGMPAWEQPAGPLVPHRADRRYGASYSQDLSDATDITCHLQLLLDPEVRGALEARLRCGTADPSEVVRPTTDLDALPGLLESAGLRALTVDLTTADVAECGMAVARVVVPGLRATGPAAFPYLGDGLDPLPVEPCLLPVPHV
jgi:ribosomal protein S12 methylthiotransferase accessory factor